MSDMGQVIIPKSDQINADDLIGGARIVTVTGVHITPGTEQPVTITLANEPRCYRPCKSMSRVLVAVWGADADAYVGRSIKLYRDADVSWGGMKVGGIRISEMTDMRDNRAVTMALTASKKARALFTVKPLVMAKAEAAQQPGPDYAAICRTIANCGTDAMRAWWGTDEGKAARAIATSMLDEMKDLAANADAAMADDPFGLPPLSDSTPEQIAAAMAEAEQAAREGAV